MEVWTGVDGLARAASGPARVVKSPGVPPSAPVVARGACATGVPGLRRARARLAAARPPVRRGHRHEREDDDRRAARRDLARGRARRSRSPATSARPSPRSSDDARRRARPSSARRPRYQLRGHASRSRPRSALILNVTPDHLDRHGTLEAYRAAKLRAVRRTRAPDDGRRRPARPAAPRPAARRGASSSAATRRDDLALRDGGALVARASGCCALDEIRLRGAAQRARTRWRPPRPRSRRASPAEPVLDALRTLRRRRAPPRGGAHARRRHLGQRLEVHERRLARPSRSTRFDGAVHLILGGQAKDQDFTTLRGAICARAAGRVPDRRGRASGSPTTSTGRSRSTRSGDLERAVAAARGAAARPARSCCCRPPARASTSSGDYEDARARIQGARRPRSEFREGVRCRRRIEPRWLALPPAPAPPRLRRHVPAAASAAQSRRTCCSPRSCASSPSAR